MQKSGILWVAGGASCGFFLLCVYLHISNVHSARVYFPGLSCTPLIIGLLVAAVLILLVSLGVAIHLRCKFCPLTAMCVCLLSCSGVFTLATPRTVARQAPLSMPFPRQEHGSGLPFGFFITWQAWIFMVTPFAAGYVPQGPFFSRGTGQVAAWWEVCSSNPKPLIIPRSDSWPEAKLRESETTPSLESDKPGFEFNSWSSDLGRCPGPLEAQRPYPG